MPGTPEIFTFFVVTLGPLKAIGPFAQRTRGVPDGMAHRIAWWAFVVGTIAVIAGGLLGRALMGKWHVTLPALTLAGGIVFFLVAIKQLLQQYEPPEAPTAETVPKSPLVAACRLVFPVVLTPFGIAGVIALLAGSDDLKGTATIIAILVLVMVLDLAAMWFSRRILTGPTVLVLQILGAVLAVLQVALSVQIILGSLRSLNVIPA